MRCATESYGRSELNKEQRIMFYQLAFVIGKQWEEEVGNRIEET